MEKVCPFVLRNTKDGPELLVFRHPLAGVQIVKGTLEHGEIIEDAALRELAEESGLIGRLLDRPKWSSDAIVDGQIWHFLPVSVPAVPDRFSFHTADDGGHMFQFFWWPLRCEPDTDWHEIFVRAFQLIRLHQHNIEE